MIHCMIRRMIHSMIRRSMFIVLRGSVGVYRLSEERSRSRVSQAADDDLNNVRQQLGERVTTLGKSRN